MVGLTNSSVEPSAQDIALHALVGRPVTEALPVPEAPPPPQAREEVMPNNRLRRELGAALDRYDRASILRPDDALLDYRIASILDRQLRPIEALIRYQLFLHRLELEKIDAHGRAYANMADAIAHARAHVHGPAELSFVDVRDLVVKAMPRRAAEIVAPVAAGPDPELVVITANRVTFDGFRLQFAAGAPEPPPTVTSGVEACSEYLGGIVAYGRGAKIFHNYLWASGDATYSGECGYLYGIVVTTPVVSVAGDGGGLVSRVSRNVVADFKNGGILASGPTAKMHADTNLVRFLHRNDEGGIFLPLKEARDASKSFDAPVVI